MSSLPTDITGMKSSFEQTLVEVWRQALVENAKVVELGAWSVTQSSSLRRQRFRLSSINVGKPELGGKGRYD